MDGVEVDLEAKKPKSKDPREAPKEVADPGEFDDQPKETKEEYKARLLEDADITQDDIDAAEPKSDDAKYTTGDFAE